MCIVFLWLYCYFLFNSYSTNPHPSLYGYFTSNERTMTAPMLVKKPGRIWLNSCYQTTTIHQKTGTMHIIFGMCSSSCECYIIIMYSNMLFTFFFMCLPLSPQVRKSLHSICFVKSFIQTGKSEFNVIDQFHKFQNAPVPYPTMIHLEQKCGQDLQYKHINYLWNGHLYFKRWEWV